MDQYDEARKWAESKYPYYFKHMDAHPWSFQGIMADIQHSLYNGSGITRKDHNLEQRINHLSGSEKEKAFAELEKAEELYARREQERKTEYMQRSAQQEKEDKKIAYKNACNRYKAKNPLYKLFHKNPAKYDWRSMDVADIEDLYRGKSR